MSTRRSLQSLHKQILKVAKQYKSYNIRNFIIRKAGEVYFMGIYLTY